MEDLNVTIDGDVWDLSTRLSYPVSKRFDPCARLGWSYTELAARASVDDQSVRLNDYDDGFSWAAGIGVRLTPRLLLNVEYSQVLLDDTDLDRVSANVSYRFGAR